MKLAKQFSVDMQEAFEFWKKQQKTMAGQNVTAQAQIDAITIEKWVMLMLKKPVYDLIGDKRASEDAEESITEA